MAVGRECGKGPNSIGLRSWDVGVWISRLRVLGSRGNLDAGDDLDEHSM